MKRVGRILREKLVSTIKDGVDNNDNVFLLSYSEVSAIEIDGLRKEMKQLGAQVYVSKNRIAKLALREIDKEKLSENVSGQTAFIWSNADAVAVSKVLMKFAEDSKKISVQGGLLGDAVLLQDDVKRLSDLPSRDELLAQVLQMILSPVTRLAGVLNGKTRDVLSILKQLSEKKGGS